MRYIRLNPKLPQIPPYQGNAGVDLYASSNGGQVFADEESCTQLLPGETKLIGTGIAVQPKSSKDCFKYEPRVGLVIARSSLANQGLALANSVGVIDENYTGEIMLLIKNVMDRHTFLKGYTRVAQLVMLPLVDDYWEEVLALDVTNRGSKGFGSTGK